MADEYIGILVHWYISIFVELNELNALMSKCINVRYMVHGLLSHTLDRLSGSADIYYSVFIRYVM